MCGRCGLRTACTELCPEAREYANQDYVPQLDLVIPLSIDTKGMPVMDIEGMSSRARKILILELLSDGKSVHDVSIHAEVDRKYIRTVAKRWHLEPGGTKKNGKIAYILKKNKKVPIGVGLGQPKI